ncbi:MAG: hypothetical protein Q4F57_09630 [Weeksellaceae bacterium]|nr:hypothetical protein [Weeksellaceae bacterium]
MKHNKKFQVPENYFEQLEQKILAQTVLAEQTSSAPAQATKVRKLWNNRGWMSAAAVILLLIGSFFIWQQQSAPHIAPANEQIAVETIYDTFFDSDYELAMEDMNVFSEFVFDDDWEDQWYDEY